MISLLDLKLSDLLPDSILQDTEIAAMAEALDRELKQITTHIDDVLLFSQIDMLPEDVLDTLAWQFHVDFYEPLGLDIDKKRKLVKNSLIWHRRKGTKSVIKEILAILFLSDFDIQEWFEYASAPCYFRIIARDFVASSNRFLEMLSAINEVKNERSHLEEIRVIADLYSDRYHGGALCLTPRFTFTDPSLKSIASDGTRYYGQLPAYTPRINCKADDVKVLDVKSTLYGVTLMAVNTGVNAIGGSPSIKGF